MQPEIPDDDGDEGPCFVSDKEILDELEALRVRFKGGDNFALFGIILATASYQTLYPEWAVKEIFKVDRAIQTGGSVDFNEVLGWKPERSVSRFNLHRRKQLCSRIVGELVKGRLEGESLSRGEDSIFERVAKALGVPRRTVTAVYRMNLWIKGVKKGHQGNIAWGDIVIPRGCRRGRPILRDK